MTLIREALTSAIVKKFTGEPIEVSDMGMPHDPNAWQVTTSARAKVKHDEVMAYVLAFVDGWNARATSDASGGAES
jgi:hypothetical protein